MRSAVSKSQLPALRFRIALWATAISRAVSKSRIIGAARKSHLCKRRRELLKRRMFLIANIPTFDFISVCRFATTRQRSPRLLPRDTFTRYSAVSVRKNTNFGKISRHPTHLQTRLRSNQSRLLPPAHAAAPDSRPRPLSDLGKDGRTSFAVALGATVQLTLRCYW